MYVTLGSEHAVCRRQHLVWVENVVRVKGCLNGLHRLNHGSCLGVMQEARLLDADAVLGADTAIYLAHVVHHKWLNHSLSPFL